MVWQAVEFFTSIKYFWHGVLWSHLMVPSLISPLSHYCSISHKYLCSSVCSMMSGTTKSGTTKSGTTGSWHLNHLNSLNKILTKTACWNKMIGYNNTFGYDVCRASLGFELVITWLQLLAISKVASTEHGCLMRIGLLEIWLKSSNSTEQWY